MACVAVRACVMITNCKKEAWGGNVANIIQRVSYYSFSDLSMFSILHYIDDNYMFLVINAVLYIHCERLAALE